MATVWYRWRRDNGDFVKFRVHASMKSQYAKVSNRYGIYVCRHRNDEVVKIWFTIFPLFHQVWSVFRDVCRFWRVFTKFPKLKRSTSDVQSGHDLILSPDTICSLFDSSVRIEKRRSFLIGHTWNEQSPDETDELKDTDLQIMKNTKIPFRERASTDGTIFSRPNRWKPVSHPARTDRRMSISMRGSKASYWTKVAGKGGGQSM